MTERGYWLTAIGLAGIAALGYGLFFCLYSYRMINNLIDIGALVITGFLLLYYVYQKKEFLFLKILGGALACCLLARLFSILYWWVMHKSPDNFSVEDLSLWGVYLFLFSADFGALDRIGDDASRNMRPYRLGALLIPVLVWLMVAGICYSGGLIGLSCFYGLFLSLAGYYAFKMLLIPDIEEGFIRVLRPYHAILTILVLLESFRYFCSVQDWLLLQYILEWAVLTAFLFLLPTAVRGIERWCII